MVARVRSGETTHAWIWIPQRGQMAIAEHGAGATIDGVRRPVRRSRSDHVDGGREEAPFLSKIGSSSTTGTRT